MGTSKMREGQSRTVGLRRRYAGKAIRLCLCVTELLAGHLAAMRTPLIASCQTALVPRC